MFLIRITITYAYRLIVHPNTIVSSPDIVMQIRVGLIRSLFFYFDSNSLLTGSSLDLISRATFFRLKTEECFPEKIKNLTNVDQKPKNNQNFDLRTKNNRNFDLEKPKF